LIRFDGPVPKNILWISIDTHRRDLWSRYGGESVMPFLDSLMAEGFALDDLYQCSNWTGAGTSCTMAGRHGIDDGFEPLLGASSLEDAVPEETVFFAEVMAAQGYTTELISTNGWLDPEWGNTQGFSTFRARGGWKAGPVMDDLLPDLLAAPDEQPWFFHAHLYDPHAPYNAPEEYLDALEGRTELPWDLSDREQHYGVNSGAGYELLDPGLKLELETQLRIRYEAESTYMDDMLKDAWRLYDASGLLDDTLVVFWADHGEAFWEHGNQTHAWDLYDEENKVAAFLWSKNIVPGSFGGPASSIDLAPTILDLYNIEAPPTMTGSVIDVIEEGRVRFSMANARAGMVQSVTQGTRRILFYWRDGRVIVTDSETDPSETVDLYAPDDPTTLEMWELLKPRVEQAEAALGTERWSLTWPPELPR
jgi:arylsulfatase A-like enzyme